MALRLDVQSVVRLRVRVSLSLQPSQHSQIGPVGTRGRLWGFNPPPPLVYDEPPLATAKFGLGGRI